MEQADLLEELKENLAKTVKFTLKVEGKIIKGDTKEEIPFTIELQPEQV